MLWACSRFLHMMVVTSCSKEIYAMCNIYFRDQRRYYWWSSNSSDRILRSFGAMQFRDFVFRDCCQYLSNLALRSFHPWLNFLLGCFEHGSRFLHMMVVTSCPKEIYALCNIYFRDQRRYYWWSLDSSDRILWSFGAMQFRDFVFQ